MKRIYASHVEFHYYSGQSCKTECSDLLYEMSRVGLMSHIGTVAHFALNRKSLSISVSFTRDYNLAVPFDSKRLPDNISISLRCIAPSISGDIHGLTCLPEIVSLVIDCPDNTIRIRLGDVCLWGRIEIKYKTVIITGSELLVTESDDNMYKQ